MNSSYFTNKKILLGVSGGIAAYKAIDLCSRLRKLNANVQVMLTPNACEFVTPLSFAALTGNPPVLQMFGDSHPIPYIHHVEDIDAFVVAPATANILAKFAHGIADDLLSSAFLANTAPVLLAPAMNVHMLEHPATQANIQLLKERGANIVDSESGFLACGVNAKGRLANPDNILFQLESLLAPSPLQNKKVLVTAGATREKWDAMRIFTNRSTGAMGLAMAREAALLGAEVSLIYSGEKPIDFPVHAIHVESAAEMKDAVETHFPHSDFLIMTAAVADYRPAKTSEHKVKKQNDLQLQLERTDDILALCGRQRRDDQFLLGFAAETENIEEYAGKKLKKKNLNAIVANHLQFAGKAENEALFISNSKTVPLQKANKNMIAKQIWRQIIQMIY